MLHLMPAEPQPNDDDARAWLLERLDFIRALVEPGADALIADSDFTAHTSRLAATSPPRRYATRIPLASGSSSVVERLPSKQDVASSSLVSRSNTLRLSC